jgi:predicted HD phosphohydrolase
MTADEATRFESEPFYREAVRVRLWDDQGKVPGLATPALADYRGLLEALASPARSTRAE